MQIEIDVFRRGIQGFTLIELMVTLAVVAVVAVVGIPGIKALLENNKVTTRTNRLVSSMHAARSEAIKRNQQVTICASSDGQNCQGDWEEGWIIKDSEGGLLLVESAPKKPVEMTADSAEIVFNGDGTVKQGSKIEIVKAGFSRKLVLHAGGSVSTCNPATDKACDDQ